MRERYKKALMWVLYALLLLTVAVIQGVVFGRTRYFGTKLSLLPVAVACIAMHGGAEDSGVFGLAAGVFWCLSGGDGGGLLILLCTLCALAAGYLCDRYLNRNLLSAAMMCLMALVVTQTLLFLFKRYIGQTGDEGWLILLRQIGLSMLACPPVYLAAWAIRKAGK